MVTPLNLSQSQFLHPENEMTMPMLVVVSVHAKYVIRAEMETVDLLLWKNEEKKVGEVQPVRLVTILPAPDPRCHVR